MILSGWMASRISARFNAWSTAMVAGGLAVARLAHVVRHWEYSERDPLRAFAVWQGGFDWPWVLLVMAAASTCMLRDRRLIAWALAPVAVAAIVWNVAYHLKSRPPPCRPRR
ncbi:prolipoprotein diacylglyceryl transferase family protein [Brevundimonas sp.]|uniref:prolipoprotein diacylglyceryl transferase family protein n=1 Tax=Brevundimonas sp. TaxID=1871086 RepID=UPI002899D897|nr:hypothetical protein [Brevundimonas sp.]